MIKRFFALILCAMMLLPMLAACDTNGEAPDGMFSTTLEGEPFILYVPNGWIDNCDSGISSAYLSIDKSILASARYYYCDAETQNAGLSVYVNNIAASNASVLGGYSTPDKAIIDTSLGGKNALRYEYFYNYGGVEANKTAVIQYYVFHGEDVIVLSFYISAAHYSEEYLTVFDSVRTAFVLCEKNVSNDDVVDKYTPEGMKKASDDGVQYACYVPKSWVTDLSDKLTYAYYPESGKPNITVTCYSPSVAITAEQYFTECETEYKKNIAGYELLGAPSNRVVAGRDALSYQYKAVYGGSEYKVMQTVLIYNDLAYSITYTARADAYDAHLSDVEIILNNFRFR